MVLDGTKYDYKYNGSSLKKIEYVEGYISNISESTYFKNIKVQIEFFSDDNQLTCWAVESQVLEVIPNKQTVYIRVFLPIQKEARSDNCKNVRWKVIGADIHQIEQN